MYMSASAPEAPPLGDPPIGCFIRLFFGMAACIMRAIWSEAPPAPAATTISTGFVGSHASAEPVNARAASPAVIPSTRICLLLLVLLELRSRRPCVRAPWRTPRDSQSRLARLPSSPEHRQAPVPFQRLPAH